MSATNSAGNPKADRLLWADRAQAAESSVRQMALRRLWGLPGTRMGLIAKPATRRQRFFIDWHFWWQAHLLDALVDAELRDPDPKRIVIARRLVRGNQIRNGFRLTNNYYDDMAWWGLALQRAEQVMGLKCSWMPILNTCRAAITAAGVVPWRRGDSFFNTPANGPVAIMLGRAGYLDQAAAMTSWLTNNLLLDDGLIADGLIAEASDEESATVPAARYRLEDQRYTYCQGVMLGAELVSGTEGATGRIYALVQAIETGMADNQVLRGAGGGDGGLFAGILARYLALVANELPGEDRQATNTRQLAAELVRTSGQAAWQNAVHCDGQVLFGPEWNQPARYPEPGQSIPENDLSVQLSGWLLMEAAASLQLAAHSATA